MTTGKHRKLWSARAHTLTHEYNTVTIKFYFLLSRRSIDNRNRATFQRRCPSIKMRYKCRILVYRVTHSWATGWRHSKSILLCVGSTGGQCKQLDWPDVNIDGTSNLRLLTVHEIDILLNFSMNMRLWATGNHRHMKILWADIIAFSR